MSEADPLVARLRAAGCVFAEDEAAELRATGRQGAALEELVLRRLDGEPLEHVVGSVVFCGLRLAVGPGTFVPRQRTALLVDEAVRLLTGAATGEDTGSPRAPGAGGLPVSPQLVDLCCGVGAVAAAVGHQVPRLRVVAGDVDAAAVRLARHNLAGVPGALVVRGDLDAGLPADLTGRVDVLTAHVPYVPSAAVPLLPPEAREHEPRTALDGGEDGLDLLRRVAARAPRWLRPGGTLLCEVGEVQVDAAGAAYEHAGLTPRQVRDDDRGALVLAGERA